MAKTSSSNAIEKNPYKHWRLHTDSHGLAWLTIDRANESANTLGRDVMQELDAILDDVSSDLPKGLIINSGKKNGFIAGADIREFGDANQADTAEIIRSGHAIFDKLENLACPTVVAISGFCLGGGLELALACDYRIALDIPSTKIGLPEVKIGIYPGLGGSVRLTERVGGLKGMELMLTGRALNARAARAAGVIDEVVGAHGGLDWHARRAVAQKRKSKGPGIVGKLSNTALVRPLLARVFRKQTAAKANPDHYPSPFALIDAWEQHRGDRARMFQAEIEEVSRLMVSETAVGLRRVFNLMERLKGLGKADAFEVKRVHVIGAGVMGGDIAAVCAARGMQVTLQDREMQYIDPALQRARKTFKKILKKPLAVDAAMTRLNADVEGVGVGRADVVIEAIFEDVDAKQALFESLEPRMKEGAVLATNTSAIPLETLSGVLNRPERLIGLHFFNPVAQMPLVEVVRSEQADEREISKGCSFCAQIGKFPLPVKSSPGFLVNRVLAPYMMKALSLHLEGRSKPTLDAAATGFGMPMGPVELADTVGLDVCLKVADTLSGSDIAKEREMLEKLVASGKLGKKTGSGLYQWEKGKPVREQKITGFDVHLQSVAERLLQPFLDECEACLRDEIVEDADLLDAGIIFGTGFAPFHGGPINYLSKSS
ncbi:MAG: 3-hydroxyacyl-CoA dehydrogenase NAD-binding domain-containing protein [Pseudomonadota bacterium]